MKEIIAQGLHGLISCTYCFQTYASLQTRQAIVGVYWVVREEMSADAGGHGGIV